MLIVELLQIACDLIPMIVRLADLADVELRGLAAQAVGLELGGVNNAFCFLLGVGLDLLRLAGDLGLPLLGLPDSALGSKF